MRSTRSIGVGYGAGSAMAGSAVWAKKSSWEMPIVATSSTKRGRCTRRRTTSSSTRAPTRRPDGDRDQRGRRRSSSACRDELGQDRGAEGADLAVGEVDDAGRPVDEHEADGEHGVAQPADEAEQAMTRRARAEPSGGRAPSSQPCSVGRRGTRPGRGRRARQVGGGAAEADLALLHEQGPVGEAEGDVHRLLDDDHRDAGGLEPLDDLESAWTTTGARPSDSSSMRSTSGLEEQGLGDGQHLLLAARQRARRLLELRAQRREQLEHGLDRARRCEPRSHLKVWAPARRFSATREPGNTALPPGDLDDAEGHPLGGRRGGRWPRLGR